MKLCVLTLAVLLLSLAACVRSQQVSYDHLFDFSGDFYNTGTFVLPLDEDPGCTVEDSGPVFYVAFNWTFATDGVRRLVLTDDYSYEVLIYSYFDPFNPCTNAVFLYENTDYNSELGEEYTTDQWFPAGFYTFVIAAADLDVGGGGDGESETFTGALFEGQLKGAILDSNPTYYPPDFNFEGVDDCEINNDDDPLQYDWYTFTANVTGYYDFAILFAPNTTRDLDYDDTYIAIYTGVPNATALQTDACNEASSLGDGVTIVDAESFYGFYGELVYVSLTAGSVYTVVYSSQNLEYYGGVYSLRVTPTRRFAIGTALTFDQPERGEYGLDCTGDSDYVDLPWAVVTFPVQPYTNVSLYGYEVEGDFYYFIYAGLNTATPPFTCPALAPFIDGEDTLDDYNTYQTGAATFFTVVLSTWSEDPEDVDGWLTDLQIGGGTPIYSYGYVPPPAVVTSAAATVSSSAATVATSSSAATVASSSSAATVATVASSSSAATVATSSSAATVATSSSAATVATVATSSSAATSAAAATTTTTSRTTSTATTTGTTGNTTRGNTTTSTHSTSASTGSPASPTTTASASHIFVSGVVAVLAVVALLF